MGEPKRIDRVLRKFLHASGLAKGSGIEEVCRAFEASVGPEVGARARVGGFRRGDLTVEVDGSALLSELSCFLREPLKEAMNARLGSERVRTIRFRLKGTAHV